MEAADELKTKEGTETGDSTLEVAPTWERLPPELKLQVLVQLPIGQRARVRRVCREWKALLDDNRRVWSDVRRLTFTMEPSEGDKYQLWLGKAPTGRLDIAGYASLRTHLCDGQSFLLPRCGGLAYMEFAQNICYSCSFEGLHVSSDWWFSEGLFQLQSLVFTLTYADIELVKLLRCQLMLRTLVAAVGDARTVLEWLEDLEDLRVLVLAVGDNSAGCAAVSKIPSQVLSRLDCLSILYQVSEKSCYSAEGAIEEEKVKAAAEAQYRRVRNKAPQLVLLEHVCKKLPERWGRYSSRILWAKEGFPVATAMADKALYSRNFLLDWEGVISVQGIEDGMFMACIDRKWNRYSMAAMGIQFPPQSWSASKRSE